VIEGTPRGWALQVLAEATIRIMMRHRPSKPLLLWVAFALIATACSASEPGEGSAADRDALARTSIAIRNAFAQGDVDAIMSYHHPDVIKALGFNNYVVGRDALRAGLTETLKLNRVEFTECKLESLLFNGDTAVEISTVTIKGTSKADGKSSLMTARAMVVYVRYKESPTGWASIREVIQPGN
jgi:ketosteroid isomerase-like protein